LLLQKVASSFVSWNKGRNVTSEFRDRAPAAMAVIGDVSKKLLVFFRRPKPFPQLLFVTARMSPHLVIHSCNAVQS
jgi:hypothetical protein